MPCTPDAITLHEMWLMGVPFRRQKRRLSTPPSPTPYSTGSFATLTVSCSKPTACEIKEPRPLDRHRFVRQVI